VGSKAPKVKAGGARSNKRMHLSVTPLAVARVAPAGDAQRYTSGMILSLRYATCLAVASMLWTSSCGTEPLDDPALFVARFCELDASGARLSTANYPAIEPMVGWSRAEPGWDVVAVILDYTISLVEYDEDTAVVRVEYDLAGLLADPQWHPLGAAGQDALVVELITEDRAVDFRLAYSHGHWLIEGPMIRPHVKPHALLEHVCAHDLSDRPELRRSMTAIAELLPEDDTR